MHAAVKGVSEKGMTMKNALLCGSGFVCAGVSIVTFCYGPEWWRWGKIEHTFLNLVAIDLAIAVPAVICAACLLINHRLRPRRSK